MKDFEEMNLEELSKVNGGRAISDEEYKRITAAMTSIMGYYLKNPDDNDRWSKMQELRPHVVPEESGGIKFFFGDREVDYNEYVQTLEDFSKA